MLKPQVVFLDVGGIILEIDWKQTLNLIGFQDQASQAEVMQKVRTWKDIYHYERGKVHREDFFRGMADLLGINYSLDLESAFNRLVVGPLPGADRIFDEFSGKVPICALSNTNDCHDTYQKSQFSILKRFDHFFTSYELGHRKPDPEIYLAAAERMKVKPEEAVFVDDSLANVEAARRLGFQAFQSVNSPEETLSILRNVFSE